MNYADYAIARDETLDYAHHPLERDVPLDEYRLRLSRAYDLEDQYVVTETGAECLHEPAPEELPIVAC